MWRRRTPKQFNPGEMPACSSYVRTPTRTLISVLLLSPAFPLIGQITYLECTYTIHRLTLCTCTQGQDASGPWREWKNDKPVMMKWWTHLYLSGAFFSSIFFFARNVDLNNNTTNKKRQTRLKPFHFSNSKSSIAITLSLIFSDIWEHPIRDKPTNPTILKLSSVLFFCKGHLIRHGHFRSGRTRRIG